MAREKRVGGAGGHALSRVQRAPSGDDAGRRHAGHLRVRCAVEPTGRFGDHARVRGGRRAKRRGADEHRQHRVRVQGDVSVHGRRAQQRDGRFQHAGRAERIRTRAFGGEFPGAGETTPVEHVPDHRGGPRRGRDGGGGGRQRRTANHHRDGARVTQRPRARRVAARGGGGAQGTPSTHAKHGVRGGAAHLGHGRVAKRVGRDGGGAAVEGTRGFVLRRRHGDDATHHGGSGDGEGTRGERREEGGRPAAQDSNEARG